ncbi:MAG: hypothetical protein CMB80_08750 [Flammeovirgaceae bacterium]|nr:hypothetical protein [Flammeovirgaceae bacterium]|tara:strand:+ start:600 stop:1142 length:543 start_codon:yes stop_codon:yes gene_type:complete
MPEEVTREALTTIDIKIWIALAVALLTFVGILISQFVSIRIHKSELQDKKLVFLRDKYEELCNHVLKSDAEMSMLIGLSKTLFAHDKQLSGLDEPLCGLHARRALNVSSLYFPSLQQNLLEFLAASSAATNAVLDVVDADLSNDDEKALAIRNDKRVIFYQSYRDKLLEVLMRNASNYSA